MKTFEVTWGGIYICEAKTEEEAIEKFKQYIINGELDNYAREWTDLIECEESEE